MKPEQLGDSNRSSIRLERAILRKKPRGDGTSGEMCNHAAAKEVAAEVGMGDDGNVGNGAAPNLVACQGSDSLTDKDRGAWMLDGTASVFPLGRVARLLQRSEGSRVVQAERTRRMCWPRGCLCVTDISRANDC